MPTNRSDSRCANTVVLVPPRVFITFGENTAGRIPANELNRLAHTRTRLLALSGICTGMLRVQHPSAMFDRFHVHMHILLLLAYAVQIKGIGQRLI